MCEHKRGKDNKAVIASNIMCAHLPRARQQGLAVSPTGANASPDAAACRAAIAHRSSQVAPRLLIIAHGQVRRRPVPSFPSRTLEVPQDGRQQTLRVHARNPPRRAGTPRRLTRSAPQGRDAFPTADTFPIAHAPLRRCMRRPPRRINHQWLSVRVLAPWQDMAVETFVKISQKCRKKFIMIQVGFARPAPRDPFPSCPVGRMLRAPCPPRAGGWTRR